MLLADLYHLNCLVDQYHLVFQLALIHPVLLADLYHLKCPEDLSVLVLLEILLNLADLYHPKYPEDLTVLVLLENLLNLVDQLGLECLEYPGRLLDLEYPDYQWIP